MKRALVLLLTGCVALGAASVALAGDNDQAAIAIHLAPHQSQLPCDNQPDIQGLPFTNMVTDGPLFTGLDAWIFVCNGSDSTGIAGMEFALDFNGDLGLGMDVFGWTLCADQEFDQAGWPAVPGAGNVVTWIATTNCQDTPSEPFVPRTVVAMAGALYVYAYSPDFLSVIPRTSGAGSFAKVASCAFAEDVISGQIPSHLGFVEFGAGAGYNPCGLPTPTESTTWGRIKQQYN